MFETIVGYVLGCILGLSLVYSLHHFYRWAIFNNSPRDPRLMLLIALASTGCIILAALASIGILGE